jgi:hypothetical protein
VEGESVAKKIANSSIATNQKVDPSDPAQKHKHIKPWTEGALLKACKAVLLLPDTIIIRRVLDSTDCAARSSWDYDDNGKICKVRIYVDHVLGGDVDSVIHELLHIVLTVELARFNKTLGEEMIKAFEMTVCSAVKLSRYKMGAWRKLVASKIRVVPER